MTIKWMLSISGEDTMTIHRKYISAWTGKLPTRLMILTNELMSPVGAFVQECCLVGPEHEEEIGTLYLRWQRWCAANGRREAGTIQVFGSNLRSAIVGIRDARRTDQNGERLRLCRGIALRDS